MDECDQAQVMSDRYLNGAIRAAQAKAAGGEGSEACKECGEGIPEARREAVPGCTRCVACQREVEA